MSLPLRIFSYKLSLLITSTTWKMPPFKLCCSMDEGPMSPPQLQNLNSKSMCRKYFMDIMMESTWKYQSQSKVLRIYVPQRLSKTLTQDFLPDLPRNKKEKNFALGAEVFPPSEQHKKKLWSAKGLSKHWQDSSKYRGHHFIWLLLLQSQILRCSSVL